MAKLTDAKGNMIYDVPEKGGISYYVKLASEPRPRKLGKINAEGVFNIERDRDRHLLIKANAYGFNEYLLRNILNPDTEIVIKEKGYQKRLRTTPQKILTEGKYLFFLTQGFEKQLFLPLDLFE